MPQKTHPAVGTPILTGTFFSLRIFESDEPKMRAVGLGRRSDGQSWGRAVSPPFHWVPFPLPPRRGRDLRRRGRSFEGGPAEPFFARLPFPTSLAGNGTFAADLPRSAEPRKRNEERAGSGRTSPSPDTGCPTSAEPSGREICEYGRGVSTAQVRGATAPGTQSAERLSINVARAPPRRKPKKTAPTKRQVTGGPKSHVRPTSTTDPRKVRTSGLLKRWVAEAQANCRGVAAGREGGLPEKGLMASLPL